MRGAPGCRRFPLFRRPRAYDWVQTGPATPRSPRKKQLAQPTAQKPGARAMATMTTSAPHAHGENGAAAGRKPQAVAKKCLLL